MLIMSLIKKNKLKNDVKNTIKIICGLPPEHPTEQELECILNKLSQFEYLDNFDEVNLREIVQKCVGKTKKHIYEGLDNSDVMTLLQQISKYLDSK